MCCGSVSGPTDPHESHSQAVNRIGFRVASRSCPAHRHDRDRLRRHRRRFHQRVDARRGGHRFALDISVLLANSYGDPERERPHLRRLLDRQVDGLIIMSGDRVRPRSGSALPLPGVPYVYLYEYSYSEPVPSVLPDDRGGAALAAQHLIDIGRRRIGFVNGPASWEATAHRLGGLRETVEAAGLIARSVAGRLHLVVGCGGRVWPGHRLAGQAGPTRCPLLRQ